MVIYLRIHHQGNVVSFQQNPPYVKEYTISEKTTVGENSQRRMSVTNPMTFWCSS